MRFYRLQSQEWLTKVHKGNGRLGDHNKYTVSSKGQRLIARIYRILIGKEKLPESARRSKIMRKETYIDKVYAQAINKFNKSNLDG
jgi:DNA-binding PadR family transcriptional regulator